MDKAVDIDETGVSDLAFPFCHIWGFQVPHVNNSQMHATNVIRIVIEQTDDELGVGGSNGNLFEDLAPSRVAVKADRVEKERVIVPFDVTTQTDRPVRDEALFARLGTSRVREDLISKSKNDIRDELLARGVRLQLGPRIEVCRPKKAERRFDRIRDESPLGCH